MLAAFDPNRRLKRPGHPRHAVQQLGNASNASYTLLPAKIDGGTHRAPAVQ